jgi:hypothetical protein
LVIFALLDPDPVPATQINADPDPDADPGPQPYLKGEGIANHLNKLINGTYLERNTEPPSFLFITNRQRLIKAGPSFHPVTLKNITHIYCISQ